MPPPSKLKIKHNVLTRTVKELHAYQKEELRERQKLEKMTADGADSSDLKHQTNVLNESQAMIPDTEKRVKVAFGDLDEFLYTMCNSGAQKAEDMEEIQKSKMTMNAASADFPNLQLAARNLEDTTAGDGGIEEESI